MKRLLLIVFCLLALSCQRGGEAEYRKGLELFQSGKFQEAIGIYDVGLKKNPKNPDLLYAAGWAHLSQGNRERAMNYFSRCIAANKDYFGGYKGMGSIYASMGDIEKAKQNYQKAISLDPKSASTYSNLGDLYRQAGERAEAEKAYRKAMELSPRFGDAANGLMSLYLEAGEPDKAVQLAENNLQKPYQQQFVKAQTYQLLAEAHVKKEDAKSARVAIQAGQLIFPDPTVWHALDEKIAKLEKPQPTPVKKK